MQVRIVRTHAALMALRSDWERLEKNATSPTQHFIWSEACLASGALNGEPHIVVVEDNAVPVAILPLVRPTGQSHLEWLGMDPIWEAPDMVYADDSALPAIAKALTSLKFPLHLRRVRADSPLSTALEKAFIGRGVFRNRADHGWSWIQFDESWKEPENHYSTSRRKDFRVRRRYAEQLGPVAYEVLTPSLEQLPAILDEAFAVEEASWKAETKTALNLDPRLGSFYRRYAASACEKGILRVCFFRINGQAAAMQLAVEVAQRIWLPKIGYDQRFARCSPGRLIFLDTFRYAATQGLKSLEFMGVIDAWKQEWTPLERSCVDIKTYPFKFGSMTQLARDCMTSVWHRIESAKLARRPLAVLNSK